MSDTTVFLLLYFVPACVCILFSWAEQILSDGTDGEYGWAVISFLPIVNIVASVVAVIILVGWLGISIVRLPTIIKEWRSK